MPACGEVNQAMEGLTGVNYNTGEQNKDMTKARQARDWKDTLIVLSHLQERNPFSSDPSLRNIATGEHALSVGTAILKSMDGRTPGDYTFKRKDQAVTLGMRSSVRIDGNEIQVDPQLLFQRLVIVAQKCDELESALNTSYVAILHLYLIPPFYFTKQRSLPSLMPSGNLLGQMF